jgi:hypothetical protein
MFVGKWKLENPRETKTKRNSRMKDCMRLLSQSYGEILESVTLAACRLCGRLDFDLRQWQGTSLCIVFISTEAVTRSLLFDEQWGLLSMLNRPELEAKHTRI